MSNLEYHKGSFCVYTPIFCQEGYCSACEIYSREQAHVKPIASGDTVKVVRKLQETGTRSSRS